MTPVFITTDVEIWPPSWEASAREYAASFRRYIHGVGDAGYGLPYQLRVMSDHGLRGVFFVEPLFTAVLGRDALQEIVGLIRAAGQEIQLHIHPEWRGRSANGVLPGTPCIRLGDLSEAEQLELIETGLTWLRECRVEAIQAFRAGGFGASAQTLRAVRAAGLRVDASQSAAARLAPMNASLPPYLCEHEGLLELPLTTYRDGFGRLRGLQFASSSAAELEEVCLRAADAGYPSVCVLSHSVELLNGARSRADRFVVQRFRAFCRFLEQHERVLPTWHIAQLLARAPTANEAAAAPVHVPRLATVRRYMEQAARRLV